jgi:hypothetical protein
MAAREARISEFNTGAPPLGRPLELLCKGPYCTHVIPCACRRANGGWSGETSTQPIQATVLG